jgi:hypothetical protein
MDAREFDGLNRVFAENASFGVTIAGVAEPVGPFEGRAAVVDFISTTTREQTDQRRHVITNVRPEGDDGATATLTLLVAENGTLTLQSCGVYRVRLADEGGSLRFSEMNLALDVPF